MKAKTPAMTQRPVLTSVSHPLMSQPQPPPTPMAPLLEYVARSVGAEASYELRYSYELLYYLVWLLLYKPTEIPHDTY